MFQSTAFVCFLQNSYAVQARFSMLSPPQIVIVRQKITTRRSIVSPVIYMLNTAVSELKGHSQAHTEGKQPWSMCFDCTTVVSFVKTNSLPNDVTFSLHLKELHVCDIFPSLMPFKCVGSRSLIMALRSAANYLTHGRL